MRLKRQKKMFDHFYQYITSGTYLEIDVFYNDCIHH